MSFPRKLSSNQKVSFTSGWSCKSYIRLLQGRKIISIRPPKLNTIHMQPFNHITLPHPLIKITLFVYLIHVSLHEKIVLSTIGHLNCVFTIRLVKYFLFYHKIWDKNSCLNSTLSCHYAKYITAWNCLFSWNWKTSKNGIWDLSWNQIERIRLKWKDFNYKFYEMFQKFLVNHSYSKITIFSQLWWLFLLLFNPFTIEDPRHECR